MSDEVLSWLFECFPEADFELLGRASRLNYTREEAIDYVLAAQATPVGLVDEGQVLLAQLVEVFPEINVSILESIVKKKSGDDDLEDLIDHVMVQQGTFEEASEDEVEAEWEVSGSKRATSRRRLSASQLSFKTNSYQEEREFRETSSRGYGEAFQYSLFAGLETPSDLDPSGIRDEINELLALRRELYGKASEQYQRGGLTGSQSSIFYAEKARDLEYRIEKLKIEASFRIFLRLNKDSYSRTLDLHLLTVDEAIPLMDAFLEHHIGSREQLNGLPQVKIITGAGNHSCPVLGPRLRPAVWRRLGFSHYKFSYDGHAVFTVYGIQPKRERYF